MNNRVYDILIISSVIVFAIVLFWIVFCNPFNTKLNGMILIIDFLSVILAFNYLTYKKDINK